MVAFARSSNPIDEATDSIIRALRDSAGLRQEGESRTRGQMGRSYSPSRASYFGCGYSGDRYIFVMSSGAIFLPVGRNSDKP
jgi:hypothetical protein